MMGEYLTLVVDSFNGNVRVFIKETEEVLLQDMSLAFFCTPEGRQKAIRQINEKGYSVPDYWHTEQNLISSLATSVECD